MPDVWVESFEHLPGKPNADRALETLKKIASLVKPIMRKHGWVLPVFAEFFPDNPNLLGLNINGGQKILVRLRPAHSPDWFYPEEDLIGTMLHELTHNVHGPHDEKFYKFLTGLQDEFDALQRSGYAGEGFYSEGKRLGTNVSHNVSPHVARAKALEAAEKRRKSSRVLGGAGGSRLGGAGGRNAGLTPRELAAKAAEQRARDEKSCASGAVAQQEADKASKNSIVNRVIDLTLDDDMEFEHHHHSSGSGSDSDIIVVEDVHPRPAGSSVAKAGPSKPKSKPPTPATSLKPATPPPAGPSNRSKAATSSIKGSRTFPSTKPPEWSCPACTLLNAQTALQCNACGMHKPLDDGVGWACLSCGEQGIPHDYWSCRWCGEVKLQS